MHDHDWPPLQRRLARAARAAMYACAAAAGAAVLVNPPTTLASELGATWAHALGALALVAGLTAAAASIAYRWQLEWVAGTQTTVVYASYTVLQWLLVAHHGSAHLASAVLLTALTAALAARGVDLWVFSLSARRAREVAGEP